ncbi:MAG: MFS transporter [Spirochaetaceae bacterium]|nr:MAG: MFS transporter [Spirochaetaceae bacterium]
MRQSASGASRQSSACSRTRSSTISAPVLTDTTARFVNNRVMPHTAQSAARDQSVRSGPIIGLLAGAHFSHHVMMAIIIPLLPFIRDEFGLSYAQSGLVTAAFTIAYGFSQLPAGWLADRIGPRYPLLAGITGVAIAGAVVGLSPLYGGMIAGLVLMGIAGGGYHPSSSAVIGRIVEPHRRGRALGLHIIGGSSSYFLSPLIAAAIVTTLGWRGTFLTLSIPVAILGLITFVLVGRMIDRPARARGVAGADRVPTAERTGVQPADASPAPEDSAGRTARTAHMTLFLVMTGIMGAGVGSTIPYIPLYLVDVRGVDEAIAASVLSIIFAAGFFAAPLGGMLSDRIGRIRVMIVTGLLTGPVIALLIGAPFPVVFAVVLLAIGILMFFRMPTSEAHILAEVPASRRSTVLGIYFFASSEAGAVLTPLLGATIDRWGFPVGIIGMGTMVTVVTLVCGLAMFLVRGRRIVR